MIPRVFQLEKPFHLMPEERTQLKVMPDAPSSKVERLVLPEGTSITTLPPDSVFNYTPVSGNMGLALGEEEADTGSWDDGFWDDPDELAYIALTPTGLWFAIGPTRHISKDFNNGEVYYTATRIKTEDAHKFLARINEDPGPLSREEKIAKVVLDAFHNARCVSGQAKEMKRQQWKQAGRLAAQCLHIDDDDIEDLIDNAYTRLEDAKRKGITFAHHKFLIDRLCPIAGIDPSDYE